MAHVEGEWLLKGCYDNGSGSFTCQHCPKTGIRFEHEIQHKTLCARCRTPHDCTVEAFTCDWFEPWLIRVGCVCAEKLTDDVRGPKANEMALKGRLRKLKAFIEHWRLSAKGNPFRKWDGIAIVLHRSGEKWAFSWDDGQRWQRDQRWFKSELETKQTAFDLLFPLRPERATPDTSENVALSP